MYKDVDVTVIIKSRRQKGLGHTLREQKSLVRRAWTRRPEGKRSLGRPQLQWGEQVVQDLRRVGGDIEAADSKFVYEALNPLRFQMPNTYS